MNAANANLINSIVLIAMGIWGYIDTDMVSKTALIPVGFGIILLLMTPGVKKENKIIAHLAVLLTLFMVGVYIGRIPKASAAGGTMLIRTIVMIATGIFAMIAFIRSFIAARKARTNA